MAIFKGLNTDWIMLEKYQISDEAGFEDILWQSNGKLIPLVENEIKILLRQQNYIDLLAIDDSGSIIIIDCKLYKNPEQKREVIAQLLDYGCSIYGDSYNDFENKIFESEGQFSIENKRRWNEYISKLSEDEKNIFRKNLDETLKYGNFIYMIAGDEIVDNLKELVRFLRTQHLNFYALEICIGRDGNNLYAVPQLYGKESSEIIAPRGGESRLWDEKSVLFELEQSNLSSENKNVIKELLNFTKRQNALHFVGNRKYASFDYRPEKSVKSIFSVYFEHKKVYVHYSNFINFLPQDRLHYIGEKLNKDLGLNLEYDIENKWSWFFIDKLVDANNMAKFEEFVKTFEEEITKVNPAESR